MPLNVKTDILALKVFATGTGAGSPAMRSLVPGHIPQLEISKINGLQAALNALVKTIASGNPTALSITNNGVGDYLVTPNFGTTANKIAQGNDARFPTSVVGLRKGAGNASLDIAAVAKTDYWDTSNFVASGASHAKGLVPDPGVTLGTTKFLCEDATWKTPAGTGTVTSVGVNVPTAIMSRTGSPVTTAGIIDINLIVQPVNTFFAGGRRDGTDEIDRLPSFRAIVFYDIEGLIGTSPTKIASGSDNRFPASVTGLRKSSGAGSTDVAAVKFTDYWDNTVFVGIGPSHSKGLVPDPGIGSGPAARFLREDGIWSASSVLPGAIDNSMLAFMPAKTLKANATGSAASPADVTAQNARSGLLLNLESITTFGNANYTALATDKYISTSATLSPDRTVTLPLANTFNPGQDITISDDAGAIGPGGLLKIARQGADTMGGSSTALVMNSTRGSYTLVSDGVNKWSVIRRNPSVNKVFLTSSGTYSTPSGVKALYVEVVGGGGGGGAAQASAANAAAGSGGGGGGYAAKFIYSPKSSYAYVVGAGGATVTAGGDTSFDSPSICTATGGAGGNASTGGTTPVWINGAACGTGTVGDMLILGEYSGSSLRLNGGQAIGGNGGNSHFGTGGLGITAAGTALTGNNYGGGGAGAVSYSTTVYNGGTGAQGVIIVTEYY